MQFFENICVEDKIYVIRGKNVKKVATTRAPLLITELIKNPDFRIP